jgi:hypothetical protein
VRECRVEKAHPQKRVYSSRCQLVSCSPRACFCTRLLRSPHSQLSRAYRAAPIVISASRASHRVCCWWSWACPQREAPLLGPVGAFNRGTDDWLPHSVCPVCPSAIPGNPVTTTPLPRPQQDPSEAASAPPAMARAAGAPPAPPARPSPPAALLCGGAHAVAPPPPGMCGKEAR